MVLYGICLNRLKSAIRKVDWSLENKEMPEMVVLEAYFLTEPNEIRRHFSVRISNKPIEDDLKDVSKALSRHSRRKLNLEFIDERDGLCLCYYPERKQ